LQATQADELQGVLNEVATECVSLASRRKPARRVGGHMAHGTVSAHGIREAIRLAAGEPELVVVDARVLRLLMGDLAQLIILGPAGAGGMVKDFSRPGEEVFVWDDDQLCHDGDL